MADLKKKKSSVIGLLSILEVLPLLPKLIKASYTYPIDPLTLRFKTLFKHSNSTESTSFQSHELVSIDGASEKPAIITSPEALLQDTFDTSHKDHLQRYTDPGAKSSPGGQIEVARA